jgi:hypothetical protein
VRGAGSLILCTVALSVDAYDYGLFVPIPGFSSVLNNSCLHVSTNLLEFVYNRLAKEVVSSGVDSSL